MTSPQEATEFNQRVGANLARLRRTVGLSQADLAKELTDRGLPFQQQTILKVEKGTRPLKFEEAQAVAEILGVPAALLLHDDQKGQEVSVADAAAMQLSAARIGKSKLREQIAVFQNDIRHYELLERQAESRLAESGAIQGIDGAWHWNNTDGSVSVLVPEGGELRTDPEALEYLRTRKASRNVGADA